MGRQEKKGARTIMLERSKLRSQNTRKNKITNPQKHELGENSVQDDGL